MSKKIATITATIITLCLIPSALGLTYTFQQSNTAYGTQNPAYGIWVTVNADPNFQNPDSWASSTWMDSREGKTIIPTMNIANGVATTKLESYVGGVWDAAAYKQDIYQGPSTWNPVPLTTSQRISYTVKSTYENTAGTSYFNLFFEVWATFNTPTGLGNAQMAELMIQQKIIVNSAYAPSIGEYTYYDLGCYGQYYLSYRAPDIPFNVWVTQSYNLNELLYNALATHYGVNLAYGEVYSIIFGIEGYSSNGGLGAQWQTVNYEKYVA